MGVAVQSNALVSLLGLVLLACRADLEVLRDTFEVLPSASPAPAGDPITMEKVELGRLLFWDPILSGHQDVACGTCHHPDFGYGDGLALSIGVGGQGLGPDRDPDPSVPLVPRNAQTVLNTGFNGWLAQGIVARPEDAPMFWDNREVSLEAQAMGPIQSDLEMRGNAFPEHEAVDQIVSRISDVPEYEALFAEAYGVEPAGAVTAERLSSAIATFERHLSQPSSAYDRWLAGEEDAMTDTQLRGLDAFHAAGCAECHSGPMFSDFELHRLDAPDQPGVEDVGDGEYRFRTPTLRNVAVTGPYMHSGSHDSLDDVMEFYEELEEDGGDGLSPELEALDLEGDDVEDDIIAFMNALTDDYDRIIPAQVPSGLPPGGDIGQ